MPVSPPHFDAEGTPAVASARRYLRGGLPAIYRRDPDGFAMRMLGSLERVLDPQVAILECLAAYLSPPMAPPDMVEAMASWLGLPPGETYGQQAGRGLLGAAERLTRLRGTREGLELALSKCFPELRFDVEDHGAVLRAGAAEASVAYPGFTVRCRERLSPALREQVRRVIEWQRPLQARCTLLDGSDSREGAR
jgi:phage tail-like protein